MKKSRILLLLLLLSLFMGYTCAAEEDSYGVEYAVPFYFQWDPRWGSVPYGTGVIANTGCGPTCLSMVAQYLTDNMDYTPEYVADYAADLGCYVPGAGTSWDLFTRGSSGLNLAGYTISLDEEVMKSELLAGHLIILSMGAGDFTRDGHFITLRGFNEEGFLVNDPNSPDKSLRTWSGYTLISQAASGWSFECVEEPEIRFDLLPGLDEELLKTLMGE